MFDRLPWTVLGRVAPCEEPLLALSGRCEKAHQRRLPAQVRTRGNEWHKDAQAFRYGTILLRCRAFQGEYA